jgi:branched-chain amino acid transport system permease protein
MSIFLSNGMMLSQGVSDRGFPPVLGWEGFNILDAKISYGQVFIIILAFALMYGLWIFVTSTKLGKAMRATAQNKPMARMLGINVDKTIRVTFMIGPGLGAAAGIMVGLVLWVGSLRYGIYLYDQSICRGHSGRHRFHTGCHARRHDHWGR